MNDGRKTAAAFAVMAVKCNAMAEADERGDNEEVQRILREFLTFIFAFAQSIEDGAIAVATVKYNEALQRMQSTGMDLRKRAEIYVKALSAGKSDLIKIAADAVLSMIPSYLAVTYAYEEASDAVESLMPRNETGRYTCVPYADGVASASCPARTPAPVAGSPGGAVVCATGREGGARPWNYHRTVTTAPSSVVC